MLTGFKSAIGLVIVVDQIPKLLGVHIEKAGFFRDLFAIAHELPHASFATIAISICVLVVIFALERFAPRSPAPLIAIAVAIAASGLLGLSAAGVATVGSIPSGLPTLVWPRFDLVEEMWPAAAGIALMSFTETIAAARAFAAPGEPRPRPNQELLALGMGNVAGGLLGAMPAGGGTTQTAVNRKTGAQTQMAELVTAAAGVATLLLFAPVIALMPQAALAAVVVAYSFDLIKPVEFDTIRRVRRIEFALGAHRVRRRHPDRNARGNNHRGHRIAARARAAGIQSARLCRWAASAAHRYSVRSRASIRTTRPGQAC